MAVISVLEWSTMMASPGWVMELGVIVGESVAVGPGGPVVGEGSGVAVGAAVTVAPVLAVAGRVAVCVAVGARVDVTCAVRAVVAVAVDVAVTTGGGMSVAVELRLVTVVGWLVGVFAEAGLSILPSCASCNVPHCTSRSRTTNRPNPRPGLARATSLHHLSSLSMKPLPGVARRQAERRAKGEASTTQNHPSSRQASTGQS
jgi:hypothetical protein